MSFDDKIINMSSGGSDEKKDTFLTEAKLEELLKELPRWQLRREFDLYLEKRIRSHFKFHHLKSESISALFRRGILYPINAMIGLAIIFFGIYTYLTPSITYGDTVFPIKKSIENIKLTLNFTKEGVIESYLNLNNRRLLELKYLTGIKSSNNIIKIARAAQANLNIPNTSETNHPLVQILDEINDNCDQLLIVANQILDIKNLKVFLVEIKLTNNAAYEYLQTLQSSIGFSTDEQIMIKISHTLIHLQQNNQVIDNKLKDLNEIELEGIMVISPNIEVAEFLNKFHNKQDILNKAKQLKAEIEDFKRQLLMNNNNIPKEIFLFIKHLERYNIAFEKFWEQGRLDLAINRLDSLEKLCNYGQILHK